MKNSNYFILSLYILLLINGCKSVVNKQIKKNSIVEEVETKTPPFEYRRSEPDSILLKRFLGHYKDIYNKDSTQLNYYSAEIFYEKDSIFKVINLYGEYVGAIYNPFAESHIAYRDNLYKEYISGETFRIDKVSPSKYLLYTDDYNRLSSNFHFYNVTFNNDSIVIE
jgi:hypothetical protein